MITKERKPVRLTLKSPMKVKKKEKEEIFTGQIVDIPDPIDEKKPDKAKYLANKNQK